MSTEITNEAKLIELERYKGQVFALNTILDIEDFLSERLEKSKNEEV